MTKSAQARRLAVLVASICLGTALRAAAEDGAAAVDGDRSRPEVIESSVTLNEMDGTLWVTTVGKIRNSSSEDLEDVVIEVQYLDRDGKLIDAAMNNLYQVLVPAGETVAFRSQQMAATTRERYASHTARLVLKSAVSQTAAAAGSTGAAGKSRSKTEDAPLLLWVPLVLFTLVALYLLRRASLRRQPPGRAAALIEQQIGLFDSQNRILERIAAAAESSREANASTPGAAGT